MTRVLDALKAVEQRRATQSAPKLRTVETAPKTGATPPEAARKKPQSPPPIRTERVHPATEDARALPRSTP